MGNSGNLNEKYSRFHWRSLARTTIKHNYHCVISSLVQAQAIEEIVVTARKKEESLQEVPISISAFSGEQMRERGISSNYEVASFTPNFNTQKMTGRDLDRPTIRGMAAPSSRGDPNASYFIDGTYVARYDRHGVGRRDGTRGSDTRAPSDSIRPCNVCRRD